MVEGAAHSGARAAQAPRGDAGVSRSLWWRVHQWAGLQLSLFLTFVFVTGALAVFSYEIDWLLRPAMWAKPTPIAERVSWGAVGEAVEAHAPEGELGLIYAPVHPAAAFDAMVQYPGDQHATHVYVHPRTGEVTGEGPWAGVQRFLRNTHRHLMLPIKYGVPIVCMAAIFLAVSLVTSFWVYKKWWRGFLRWPRGRTARALIGDLHRFMGVWSLWFVLAMIVTGIWYLVEELGASAPPLPHQAEAPARSEPAPALSRGAALDRGVDLIREQWPDYRVEQVSWPAADQSYFEVHGHTGRAILVRPRANAVRIDATTGDIVSFVDPRALSAHQRISEAADPLHFGTLGGYPTRIVWFLFGAALSALSITGVVIYALRLAKAERRPATWRHGAAKAWRAMGPLRWPALGLSLLAFVLAPFAL